MKITHNNDGSIGYEVDGLQMRIDVQEKLSEHFSLREMIYSAYGEQHQILNLPRGPQVIEALRALCTNVLEPLRQALGQPVIVTSGYRTECLNFCVGGVKNSQHVRGEAADLFSADEAHARTYYDYIRAHLPFDQLLLEYNCRTHRWWVHVSYTTRRDLRRDARMMAV